MDGMIGTILRLAAAIVLVVALVAAGKWALDKLKKVQEEWENTQTIIPEPRDPWWIDHQGLASYSKQSC